MPPAAPPSNVRAFVNLKESTVYAGEEIQCIITFKNIARPTGAGSSTTITINNTNKHDEDASLNGNGRDHSRKTSNVPATPSRRSSFGQSKAPLSRATSSSSIRGIQGSRGHRPSSSVNVIGTAARSAAPPVGAPGLSTPAAAARPAKGHGRSISIMSMGGESNAEARAPVPPAGARRAIKAHARSSSLQHVPRSNPQPIANAHLSRDPSPLYESTTPPSQAEPSAQALPLRPGRRRNGTVSAGNTPQLSSSATMHKKSNTEVDVGSFRFPAPSPDKTKPVRTASTMHSSQNRSYSPRPADAWQGQGSSGGGNFKALSRVMSESSVGGTPRTSSEFYSHSNNSDDTLTSELYAPAPMAGRLSRTTSHSRQASRSPQSFPSSAEPETLMMAYVQTRGSFALDGSLVNVAPFEDVKRRGVQGGGGVVGVEHSKRSSGMFGAFSWGNLGESLGGLLGVDELSSIAKMKASARSKAIPLLSTPQSLLFIDLRLAPGESRSYSYRFKLPFGLPPSYRGRAIKTAYSLVLGVQRPESQAVVHVEVPFRVLGSYDAGGDLLSHDLMSPYVLLQDAAKTAPLSTDPTTPISFASLQEKGDARKAQAPKQGLEDFLRYTERLLNMPKDTSGGTLYTFFPHSPALSRQPSIVEQLPTNIKDAIDLAILRSNYGGPAGRARQSDAQVANRFNIARSGQPVAVLTVLRPAFKLGETVTGTIDFTAPAPVPGQPASAPTYSVLVELESSEQIDAALALRSAGSVHRVTRKVYASVRESALFARRLSFNLTIPAAAAPTFETTGVSLVWQLKIEFTTQRAGSATASAPAHGLGIDAQSAQVPSAAAAAADDELLEVLGSDERGSIYVARERLLADTFDISVPLRVYGTVGIDHLASDDELLLV